MREKKKKKRRLMNNLEKKFCKLGIDRKFSFMSLKYVVSFSPTSFLTIALDSF